MLKRIQATFWVCLFILCWTFAPQVEAKDLSASEIINQIIQQRTYLINLQAGISFMLLETKPLKAPGTSSKTATPTLTPVPVQMKGTLNYSEGLKYNLFLDAPEGTWRITSLNTRTLEGVKFIPKFSNEVKSEFTVPTSIVCAFPPNLNPTLPNQIFLLLGEEVIFDKFCYILETDNEKYKLWVNKEDLSIYKMQTLDADGKVLTAYYRNFYRFEPGFLLYSSVEVLKDNVPLYTLQLLNPSINLAEQELRGFVPLGPLSESGKISPINFEENFWEKIIRERFATKYRPAPIFNLAQKIILLILLLGLLYMLFREIRLRMQRPVFAKELIVIDNDDFKFSNLLKNLGYEIVNFSPELLTEERKIVSTPGRKAPPRAVIAAPGAFAAIKSYLFLLRAYVEEGGRVLVLPQAAAYAHTLPFKPQFYPFNQYNEGRVFFVSRNNIWQRITGSEVESKVLSMAPEELYLKVEDRDPDPILEVKLPDKGLKPTAICMLKQGKGEYLLCQLRILHLLEKNYRQLSIANRLFRDLIDYLQGRKAEPVKK